VIVLDRGGVAVGETSRTSAHLSTVLDKRWFELERLHGEKSARLAYESHADAIGLVESIVRKERIDCGFERVDGWLFAPPGTKSEVIDRELDAARRVGVQGVQRSERAPIEAFDTGPALRFPRQAEFHPLRYLTALVIAAERAGARFWRGHAAEVVGGAAAHVKTDAGRTIEAGSVVVATNTPINDMVEIHTKQPAYRTYVVSMRVPRGAVARALYWDTADPYHYVRLASWPPDAGAGAGAEDFDLLLVGGEDHRTALADDASERFDRLVSWARARFPAKDVVHRWSGQVFEPIDGLALIGRNPRDEDNVYVATGFSGNGLTYGTIAATLLSDLVAGRENAGEKLYDPARKSGKAAPAWLKENVAGLPGYTKWLTPGDVKSVRDVAPGESAVIRRGKSKVAVHRDEKGRLHEVSAACTHLGGVLCWNSLEKSWDCPLHGSRFDADGHVVCGPANFDLAVVAKPAAAKASTPKRVRRTTRASRRLARKAPTRGAARSKKRVARRG